MPLPVAHGLIGAGVVAVIHPSRKLSVLLVGALLAISPDFEYALNWLRLYTWNSAFRSEMMFDLIRISLLELLIFGPVLLVAIMVSVKLRQQGAE
jgi:hypothetical protein